MPLLQLLRQNGVCIEVGRRRHRTAQRIRERRVARTAVLPVARHHDKLPADHFGHLPAEDFQTRRPLILRRGDVGTVVMAYDGSAFEVEFPGRDGRAHAVVTVPAGQLMALHFEPSQTANAT